MTDPTSDANAPRPPHGKEYEDPQYHDEDQEVPLDEQGRRPTRQPGSRKPARRIPPPRRRYYED